LLAQGQVLEGELAVATDEEGEEPEQVEEERDHEARLWSARADRSTTWLPDQVLARDKIVLSSPNLLWASALCLSLAEVLYDSPVEPRPMVTALIEAEASAKTTHVDAQRLDITESPFETRPSRCRSVDSY
jgi:hypothetical protein